MTEPIEPDWKERRNHLSAKQLAERLTRQRREEYRDLLARYGHDLPEMDDLEPPPKVD